jgi:hypothetical protein
MPRRNRNLQPFRTYLTTQSGNKNQPLFREPQDAEAYRAIAWDRARAMGLRYLRVFVVENGVLHLVMAEDRKVISVFESQVKSRYSRHLNDKYCQEPEQLLAAKNKLGEEQQKRAHVGEANFRPRFDSLEVRETHLAQLRSAGWQPEELPKADCEKDWKTEQAEWLPALEAALRGVPALLLPALLLPHGDDKKAKGEEEAKPEKPPRYSPRYSLNSPFWYRFPVVRKIPFLSEVASNQIKREVCPKQLSS